MAENFFYLEKKTSNNKIQETEAIKKKKMNPKETHPKTHENGSDATSRRPKKQQEKSNLLHTRVPPPCPTRVTSRYFSRNYRPRGDRQTEYTQNAEGKTAK